jgi:polysaccharide pyruvyl transferase WcaK-like protein
MKIGIVPPTESIGSLGDQMLIKGLYDQDPSSQYDLILENVYQDWSHFNHDHYAFGKVFLNHVYTQQYDKIVIIGADVLDGTYNLNLIQKIQAIFKQTHCNIYISSFSWSMNPNEYAIRAIKMLNDHRIKWEVRDEISLLRFKKLFPNHSVELIHDFGFYVKLDRDEEAYGMVGESILVNLNDMHKKGDKFLIELLTHIPEKYHVFLLQHDFRQGHREEELLHNLHKGLKNKSTIVQEGNVNYLKNIYSKVKYVISSRMHIGIAALSMGIPFIGMEYQDKMEGILKRFNLEELTCKSPSSLEKLIYLIEENLNHYKNEIKTIEEV